MQKEAGGLLVQNLLSTIFLHMQLCPAVSAEELWKKQKKYKNVYVFSIAKLDSVQRECSQTNSDLLSKM